ncbi:MAG: signal peptidase I [Thaumarchaeota archaeon]|nr:signal peptidase I [Nitrososphaerota archaeon]
MKNRAASGFVKDIIIVVIGIAIIWIGLRIAFGTENPFYVVSSGSMVPTLNVFDVIVVNGNIPFDKIHLGDIIVFHAYAEDKVIVHRVAQVLSQNPEIIRTKGDANPGSIPGIDYPIAQQNYIGKVVYVIPQIGYVTRVLTPPINYIIIAVIVGIMIVKQFGNKPGAETAAAGPKGPEEKPGSEGGQGAADTGHEDAVKDQDMGFGGETKYDGSTEKKD